MRMQDNQLPDRRHPMLQGRIICGHIPDFVELKSIQLYKVGIYYTLIINGHQYIYFILFYTSKSRKKSLFFQHVTNSWRFMAWMSPPPAPAAPARRPLLRYPRRPLAPRPGSSASCHRRHGDGPAVSGQNGEGNGWRYGDMDRYIYI